LRINKLVEALVIHRRHRCNSGALNLHGPKPPLSFKVEWCRVNLEYGDYVIGSAAAAPVLCSAALHLVRMRRECERQGLRPDPDADGIGRRRAPVPEPIVDGGRGRIRRLAA
jgi:hypothetical protein